MLRLGFIGGSVFSAIGYTHYIASRMDNKFCVLSACFSTNEEINIKTANLWDSNIRIYSDYKKLLQAEQGNIDAILILTPTTLHKSMILECFYYGYPVICEKTLCVDLNESKEIVNSFYSKRNFLSVIFNYTGYPMLRELKYMISNGEFGEIFQINIEMPQESFIIRNKNGEANMPQAWRLNDGLIPTIALDLGIHCHNLIDFLIGKKALSVFCKNASYGNFKVIDNINIFATYEDNISVNMWFSKCALGYRNGLRMRIFGSKLSCEWLQTNPEELIINTSFKERIIKDRASFGISIASKHRYNRFKAGHPQGFMEAFANYYDDISHSLQAFLDNKDSFSPYVFGLRESIEGLLFFDSAKQSMNNKMEVAIDYSRI